jgi:hypothetical protein
VVMVAVVGVALGDVIAVETIESAVGKPNIP